jgi:hypothetical protein
MAGRGVKDMFTCGGREKEGHGEEEGKSHWFHCVAHMHSLSLSAD